MRSLFRLCLLCRCAWEWFLPRAPEQDVAASIPGPSAAADEGPGHPHRGWEEAPEPGPPASGPGMPAVDWVDVCTGEPADRCGESIRESAHAVALTY
jgi:hypothetical protein